MAADKIPMTKEGFARLEEELRQLKTVERPQIIVAISQARELGDLSENAEYHSSREKQSFIEGRILELEEAIGRAQVIDTATLKSDKIVFGTKVKVVDEGTGKKLSYQIVGQYEADIEKGLISVASPLGRALLGKGEGDAVEFATPKGTKSFTIIKLGA
ncbi:transcription elongation factor GreA [Alphaproteobacteria bacterium]|nr:transcription elongation factor GreA [Alphaproteobacteria bacterium]